MKTNQADFPVRAMCRVLDISPSGYYAWLGREPSARAKRDKELTERIETVWRENRRVYGRPRIYADLKEAGERVGEKRVGRLMKQAEIVGASRRRRGPKTTIPEQEHATSLVPGRKRLPGPGNGGQVHSLGIIKSLEFHV